MYITSIVDVIKAQAWAIEDCKWTGSIGELYAGENAWDARIWVKDKAIKQRCNISYHLHVPLGL